MLWIALRLPQLPLDIFLRGAPTPEPFAVVEGHHVLACDRKAGLRGVRPGLAAPAALALAPRLIIKPRDAAAETEALLGLAAWAMQFTPAVALEFPDSLMVEISGSLKLLGGLDAVLARMRAGLTQMGFSTVLACAPTLRAACWMSHACADDSESLCLEPKTLERSVSALPLSVLPEAMQQGLQAIGATCIGDVLALPRPGLARRFGQRLLDDIDRALGRLPEVRTYFQPPAKFHATIELPAEVTQSDALLFAARRLLMQLSGFLAARSAGIHSITLRLAHRETSTEVLISMLAPSRDASHFTLLLREQVARLALREPVRAITVSAEDIVPFAGNKPALFAEDAGTDCQSWERLIERLRARLGSEAVQSISLPPDHRPEQTGGLAQTPQLQLGFGERPFWLLPSPRPLTETASAPQYEGEGPLELLAGPERIESGWWDGNEAMRDYFVARSPHRSLLWIYRERHPSQLGQWYLHGIFS